jgi:hypothetical protein
MAAQTQMYNNGGSHVFVPHANQSQYIITNQPTNMQHVPYTIAYPQAVDI